MSKRKGENFKLGRFTIYNIDGEEHFAGKGEVTKRRRESRRDRYLRQLREDRRRRRLQLAMKEEKSQNEDPVPGPSHMVSILDYLSEL